ncbi:hypothetical protein FCM35_KLT17037 [Carex littledalei]|uniref:Uncharacterized protein n=1 Tax=Carex littledalei TaxID=544730 RepID=A0A833R4F9_9POAL|nr:hypothetical protein FCM35_KLT17037 [Carex littledalei]
MKVKTTALGDGWFQVQHRRQHPPFNGRPRHPRRQPRRQALHPNGRQRRPLTTGNTSHFSLGNGNMKGRHHYCSTGNARNRYKHCFSHINGADPPHHATSTTVDSLFPYVYHPNPSPPINEALHNHGLSRHLPNTKQCHIHSINHTINSPTPHCINSTNIMPKRRTIPPALPPPTLNSARQSNSPLNPNPRGENQGDPVLTIDFPTLLSVWRNLPIGKEKDKIEKTLRSSPLFATHVQSDAIVVAKPPPAGRQVEDKGKNIAQSPTLDTSSPAGHNQSALATSSTSSKRATPSPLTDRAIGIYTPLSQAAAPLSQAAAPLSQAATLSQATTIRATNLSPPLQPTNHPPQPTNPNSTQAAPVLQAIPKPNPPNSAAQQPTLPSSAQTLQQSNLPEQPNQLTPQNMAIFKPNLTVALNTQHSATGVTPSIPALPNTTDDPNQTAHTQPDGETEITEPVPNSLPPEETAPEAYELTEPPLDLANTFMGQEDMDYEIFQEKEAEYQADMSALQNQEPPVDEGSPVGSYHSLTYSELQILGLEVEFGLNQQPPNPIQLEPPGEQPTRGTTNLAEPPDLADDAQSLRRSARISVRGFTKNYSPKKTRKKKAPAKSKEQPTFTEADLLRALQTEAALAKPLDEGRETKIESYCGIQNQLGFGHHGEPSNAIRESQGTNEGDYGESILGELEFNSEDDKLTNEEGASDGEGR